MQNVFKNTVFYATFVHQAFDLKTQDSNLGLLEKLNSVIFVLFLALRIVSILYFSQQYLWKWFYMFCRLH